MFVIFTDGSYNAEQFLFGGIYQDRGDFVKVTIHIKCPVISAGCLLTKHNDFCFCFPFHFFQAYQSFLLMNYAKNMQNKFLHILLSTQMVYMHLKMC